MGRTIEAKAGMTPMWRARGDETGELIQNSDDGRYSLVEPDAADYVSFPHQTTCRWQLSGISEEFELESAEYGKSVKTRVELRCLKAAGKQNAYLEGKRTTLLFTWTVSAKSKLGALLGTLRGQDIGRGENLDVDAFIGTEFVAPLYVNDKGYSELDPRAIEAGKTKLSALLNGAAPAAAPVADANGPAPAGAGEADPFEAGDEDL